MTSHDHTSCLEPLDLEGLLERTVELHEVFGTFHSYRLCPPSPPRPRTVVVGDVQRRLCSRCTPSDLAPALEASELDRLWSQSLARARFGVRDLPSYARTRQRLLALEAFLEGANLPLSPMVEPARLHLVQEASGEVLRLRAELSSEQVRAHVLRVCVSQVVVPPVPAPLQEVGADLVAAWRSSLERGLTGEALALRAARVVASLAPQRALPVEATARLAAKCVRGWDDLLGVRVRSDRDLLAVVEVHATSYWTRVSAAVAAAFSLRQEGNLHLLRVPGSVLEWLGDQPRVSGLSRTVLDSPSPQVVENVSALWDTSGGPLSVASTLLAAALRV